MQPFTTRQKEIDECMKQIALFRDEMQKTFEGTDYAGSYQYITIIRGTESSRLSDIKRMLHPTHFQRLIAFFKLKGYTELQIISEKINILLFG